MIRGMPGSVAKALSNISFDLDTPSRLPEIEALLNRTVLFGGKRFRPLLCLLFGHLLKLELEKLAPFGRSAEFTHAASLAHDDVIDEADKRRNRPTINKISSNARAVLAGDILLARVMTEVSGQGSIEITQDLSHVVRELVEGEWLQLEARGRIDVTEAHLERVASQKTASLLAWCCQTPVRLCFPTRNPSTPQELALFEAAGRFGRSIGLAFQFVDDVLDFESTSEKPVAQDLREGLVNFVTFEMLRAHPELKGGIRDILMDPEPRAYPWTPQQLSDAQSRVRARAENKLALAELALQEIQNILSSAESPSITGYNPEALEPLRGAMEFLGARKK